MSERLKKISEKSKFVEVYHIIMKASEQFSFISRNIPRQLLQVVQNIHGRFDDAAFNIFKAINKYEKEEKFKYLNEASDDIFYQYNSLEYLVKTKAITINAANTVIEILEEGYLQIEKWKNSILKSDQKS